MAADSRLKRQGMPKPKFTDYCRIPGSFFIFMRAEASEGRTVDEYLIFA